MGGVLDVHTRDIQCKVYRDTIPKKIRVNLQGLEIGKKIRINEVGVCWLFVLQVSSVLYVVSLATTVTQLPADIVPKNPDLFLAKIVGRYVDQDSRQEE